MSSPHDSSVRPLKDKIHEKQPTEGQNDTHRHANCLLSISKVSSEDFRVTLNVIKPMHRVKSFF